MDVSPYRDDIRRGIHYGFITISYRPSASFFPILFALIIMLRKRLYVLLSNVKARDQLFSYRKTRNRVTLLELLSHRDVGICRE